MGIEGEPTRAPNPEEFMIRVRHVNGEVVWEFSHSVKHFRLHPEIMMNLNEAAIAASLAAAEYLQKKSGAVVQVKEPPKLILPNWVPKTAG